MLIEWPFPASATIVVYHLAYPRLSHAERMEHISHHARFNLKYLNRK